MLRRPACYPRIDRNCALFVVGSVMLAVGISAILILDLDASSAGRVQLLALKLKLLGYYRRPAAAGSSRANITDRWRIPRLIHYASEADLVSLADLRTMNSCLARNPGWSVWLWTDPDVRLLLHGRWPGLLTLYDSLGSQEERQLLAKFPVLFSMGGVFLETDMQCLRPLEAAVAQAGRAGAFVSEERPENAMILENSRFKLATGAMGACPGNQWFGFVIDTMLGGVRHNWEDLSLDDAFLTNCYQLWLDISGGDAGTATGCPAVLPWQYFSPGLRDPETMVRLCQQVKQWPSLAEVYTARHAACNSSWQTGADNISHSIGAKQYNITQATKYFNAKDELRLNCYSRSPN